MNFQLVRASDNEIAIWNTDHGHIFVYSIDEGASSLRPLYCKDVPDAELTAASMREAACDYATEQARVRHLLA